MKIISFVKCLKKLALKYFTIRHKARSSDCSHWCDDVARSAGDTLEVLLSDIVRTQFVAKATVVKATVVGVDDANDITTSAVDR